MAGGALVRAQVEAGQRCIALDAEVDALQEQMERRILTVIARRQPAATDLRFLGAMYRALADVERAGDYAVHVARDAIELAARPPLKKYLDMERILQVLGTMIETTIAALTSRDHGAARDSLRMDNEIDELYEQIQRELLSYMIEDPAKIDTALKLLNVARYLERLGDHLENVNEHIIFWLTNERL